MLLFWSFTALADPLSDALASGDLDEAEALLAARVEQVADVDPVADAYNLACVRARRGETGAALDALERAVRAGFADAEHARADADLASLADEPRFGELLVQMAAISRAHELERFATPFREELPAAERVAGLSLIWSEVAHGFAWFDQVPELDWDARYLAAVDEVLAAPDTEAYYGVLTRLVAELHDGHTSVWPPRELMPRMFAIPPVRPVMIDDRVWIERVDARGLGVRVGDELLRVDGVPVRDWAAEHVLPYVSASTPQDRDERAYGWRLLAGAADSPVELTLRRDDAERTVVLTRGLPAGRADEPVRFRTRDGVGVLTIDTFGTAAVAAQLDRLWRRVAAQRALVIDLRDNGGGSSAVGFAVLDALTDDPISTSCWSVRADTAVDRARGTGRHWTPTRCGTHHAHDGRAFDGPVAVISGPATYSAAEDFLVAFRAMRRGTIVGEASGGSTGQPVSSPLPGGGGFRVCAKRDTAPDGTAFVGVGVRPDVVVVRTPDDLRRGRDPVLEAALAAVAGQ